MQNVHIGSELFVVAKRHKLPITEIARRSGYGQSMFYKHIKKPDLSFSILKRYADTMDYYFKNEIPKFYNYLLQNGLLKTEENDLTRSELLDKVEYWKDQAFDLTKRNNDLLQQIIDKQQENDRLRREVEDCKRKLGKI